MKSKLLAIIAAFVLLTGCQSEPVKELEPQTEVEIDKNTETEKPESETESEDQENESSSRDEESGQEESAPDQDDESDKTDEESDQNQVSPDGETSEADNTTNAETDTPEKQDRIGMIPESNIEGGVREACTVLLEMHTGLNNESLESLDVEGLYENYWIQPYKSVGEVKTKLRKYFTEATTLDIIEKWGLLEYKGKVICPEVQSVPTYALDIVDVKISEVDENTNIRYINMGFENTAETKNNSLLVLRRGESDDWKLDTIPGTGLIKSFGDTYIRDVFWVEGNAEWNWPEFITREDKAWMPILSAEKADIKRNIQTVMESFVPEAPFKTIGADQLNYWITWNYKEQNPDYPNVDITLSEYMKYGIHPNHSRRTVTLSKITNKELFLKDIFSDEVRFKELVNVFIDGYMKEHEGDFYDGAVFEGIDEHTQFYLSDKGLVFYFQLYEYAPYAYGYPEIEIPFTYLKEALKPRFQAYAKAPVNAGTNQDIQSDSENNTESSAESNAEGNIEKKTENAIEKGPEQKTEEKTEEKTDEMIDPQPENEPDDKTEEETQNELDKETGN